MVNGGNESIMRLSAAILILSVCGPAGALEGPPALIFVNSHAVVLSFDIGAAGSIDGVEVWLRGDKSASWAEIPSARVSDGAVRFKVDRDGRFGCYLSLRNAAGRSASSPTDRSAPHVIVVVDTAPPTLQAHRAYVIESDNRQPRVRLDLSLVEENLGEKGLRLFYRSVDGGARLVRGPDATSPEMGGEWRDGGAVSYSGGMVEWRPPAETPGVVDVRLVATDLAGNRALEELSGVRTTPVGGDSREFAATQPSAGSSTPVAGDATPLTPPILKPVVVPPVLEVVLDDAVASLAPTKANPQSELLRRQAAGFLSEGRLALAGARLRDALELTPHDPDVNADMGRVLYRTRQYAEAGRRFQLALDENPKHEAALEGLSLAEFTQHQYSDARGHLRRLLELRPDDSEQWLHYGDVEHMLGNRRQASKAWEKALALNSSDEGLRERTEKRMKLLARRGVATK